MEKCQVLGSHYIFKVGYGLPNGESLMGTPHIYIRRTARSMKRSRLFFLKSHILGPDDRNLPIFFPSVVYPLYLHVIIDFGHIWGPFMAEIEKMCQKSAFLVVSDFGYPQSRCPP